MAKPKPWASRRIFAFIAWMSKNLLKWDSNSSSESNWFNVFAKSLARVRAERLTELKEKWEEDLESN
ncbi:hypothetical protein RNM28_01520 [Mesomycoplasma ovipneumoniae]|uniref:hypothetical protein n=1 Tax=Mesomycoplasma ovipneumoniae TaxID=29562 RepID=UPI0028A73199|nr:hypothetical protein [Mesomycoplasma ovipneumoniae]WNM17600.1 hypothetical protein RNM28_01520 [Mesomycoplasma ovipneumoniae]